MKYILEQIVSKNIERQLLLDGDDCVIVALSGGADSVALLSVLVSLGYKCVAAHCNFHLRGDESNRDEFHAQKIAKQLGVECKIIHFDVVSYEKEHGVSTEMACRELRYEWFEQLRRQYNAEAIAVAHHRDDDVETMFLNLLRGSGIAGVSAMKWKNEFIVRPMLNVSRIEVEAYLQDKGLDYVIDSTNAEVEYKRNRLRNIVIPMLRDAFPECDDMLVKSLRYLKENNKIYQKTIADAIVIYQHENEIDLLQIVNEYPSPATLLREMLAQYGFNETHIEGMIKAVNESGRKFYSQHWQAFVNRGKLIIMPQNEYIDECDEYEIDLLHNVNSPIKLQVENIGVEEFKVERDGSVIYLDESVLDNNPRIVLRRWRKGDRIALFGLKGTKKLSDVFSDAKLSIAQKKQLWVLERDGVILWIVGMRTSRYFAKTTTTQRLLRVKLVEKS